MKIRVKYDNQNESKAPKEVIFDLPAGEWELMIERDYEERKEAATEGECVVRRSPQEIMDTEFNKPLYNNWRAQADCRRHRGELPNCSDDEDEASNTTIEDVADIYTIKDPINHYRKKHVAIADMNYVSKDEIAREQHIEYEIVCQTIYQVLHKKPDWADAVISVYVNEEPIRSYASRIGANENNITQKLKRAKKKLKIFFVNRQI